MKDDSATAGAGRIGERIAASAYRHWRRHGMTEWPSVRETAKRLGISQREIEACSGDGHYDLTGFNFHEEFCGEITVEATTDDVERDWCAYWLRYSGGCYCGHHRAAPAAELKSSDHP